MRRLFRRKNASFLKERGPRHCFFLVFHSNHFIFFFLSISTVINTRRSEIRGKEEKASERATCWLKQLSSDAFCFSAQGRYTCKGDVWAFAVTLWEILTFAREQPFEEMPDHRIVENATYFYQEDERKVSRRSEILRRLIFIVSDVLNVMSAPEYADFTSSAS